MKKFLSLALALVMTMSLVTISAGAKDFTDNSKIAYKEAVDVMSSVKVIDGYADGAFNPANTLTRGAAAKIICNMILGPTTASALSADAAPYKDVPANHTFAGYIAYCAQQKIISGYADGTFRPAGTVTGYQFMKMLLGALGYDATTEGFTGANWSINVAKLASSLSLDKGNSDFVGTKAMTREEACLYAFNTLKATMVEYNNNASDITIGGVTISQGKGKATEVVNNNTKTIKNDKLMQFAEKYFKDLKMASGASDAFNRPATTWTNKSVEIGTYADKADASYTKKTAVGTIYSDLGLSKNMAAASIATYVDGNTVASKSIIKGDTENKVGVDGALTEVYYDDDNNTVVITTVNTYVGKITATYAATASKDAYVKFDTKTGAGSEYETDATYAVDDYVIYTYSSKTGDVGVKSMAKADVVTGTLTAYTAGKSVTVAGTAYKTNGLAASAATINDTLTNAMKTDVSVYLDAYGYAAFVDADAASDNYAVVLGYTGASAVGNMGDKTASLLFADGTTKTVTTTSDTVFAESSANVSVYDIVSYRINSEGKYKLDVLADVVSRSTTGVVTTKGTSTLGASLVANKVGAPVNANYANGKTVVLVKNGTTYSAYKGFANMPSISIASGTANVTVYATGTSPNVLAKVIFVEKAAGTSITSTSKDVTFIKGNSNGISQDVDLNGYYQYDAIINGEITTIKTNNSVTSKTLATNLGKDSKGVYDVSSYNYVNAGHTTDVDMVYGVGTEKASNGSIKLAGGYYSYASDVKVFTVAANGDMAVSSIGAIVKDDDDKVWLKVTSNEVTTIVVETVDPAPSIPGTSTGDTLTLAGSTFSYGYTVANGVPSIITVRAAVMNYVAANMSYTWNAAVDSIAATATPNQYTARIDGIVYTINVAAI